MGNKKVNTYAYVLTDLHLCRINLTQLCENIPPQFEVILDFQKQELPVGMGGFLWNSKLYLTGGENIPPDTPEYQTRLVFEPGEDTSNAYNTHVYVVDPSSTPSSCTIQHQIPPLLASKTDPQIAVIDDKVYILRDLPCFLLGLEVSPPSFECYDPDTNLWEGLPTPPGFEKRVSLCYFNVMNRQIHIRNVAGICLFYDVDLQKWFSADDEGFLQPYGINRVIFPFHAHCLVAQCENGLILSYTRKGLVAYIYGDDGTIKYHRRLHEVNGMFKGSPEYSLGFVKDLGEGKFCYVYSLPGTEFTVSIIQVEIQSQAGDLSVVVNLLHGPHTVSMFHSVCMVKNVFIMCEDSKKRGAESVDIDKSCKKQGLIS